MFGQKIQYPGLENLNSCLGFLSEEEPQQEADDNQSCERWLEDQPNQQRYEDNVKGLHGAFTSLL